MKTTKIILLAAVVAAFSFSAFAGTGATQLRAPVASNVYIPADATVTTITYVESSQAQLSPRAQGNQIKVIKGSDNDQALALGCRKNMVANPKAVAECASHATMPGCVTVAPLK